MKFASFVLIFAAVLAGCREPTATELKATAWRTTLLPPDGATLPTPRSLAVDAKGNLAVLDTAGRVLIYDSSGVLQRQWKMLDVSVGKPEGVVLLRDGRVVVCDTHYHRVVWFTAQGEIRKIIGRKGEGPGEFIYPVGICADPQENLYVCEYGGNDRVQKFTQDGKWLAAFGSFGTGPRQFQRPSGLTWHNGRIYVADAINNRVLVFTETGEFVSPLGTPSKRLDFQLPYDIEVGRR
jgi:DNA-binding beta-propeller fold protein YncE